MPYVPRKVRFNGWLSKSLTQGLLTGIVLVCLMALVDAQDTAEKVAVPKKEEVAPTLDYSRQIRSILSNNCFQCHGPDEKERKGGCGWISTRRR